MSPDNPFVLPSNFVMPPGNLIMSPEKFSMPMPLDGKHEAQDKFAILTSPDNTSLAPHTDRDSSRCDATFSMSQDSKFNVQTLMNIINEHVPKTHGNKFTSRPAAGSKGTIGQA
jgi:hypothetical protein